MEAWVGQGRGDPKVAVFLQFVVQGGVRRHPPLFHFIAHAAGGERVRLACHVARDRRVQCRRLETVLMGWTGRSSSTTPTVRECFRRGIPHGVSRYMGTSTGISVPSSREVKDEFVIRPPPGHQALLC